MLGRLLNTAAASLTPSTFSSKSSAAQLQSVTEEEHTSGLLFTDPDTQDATTQTPPHASTACNFDDRGHMEFDITKDIRVIISQNAMGDRDPCLLFDSNNCLFRNEFSKPPSGSNAYQTSKTGNDRSGRSGVTLQNATACRTASSRCSNSAASFIARSAPSKSSPLMEASNSRRAPTFKTGTLFGGRRGSTFTNQRHETNNGGTSSSSRAPDAMGMLNCIFGSNAFGYRDPAIKFHVFPQSDDACSGGLSGGSFGGSSHATAPDNSDFPDFGPTRNNEGFSKPVSVMITRMFSVDLPATNPTMDIPPGASRDQQKHNHRRRNSSITDLDMRLRMGGKKTPMFAVTIIIRLAGTKHPPRRSTGQNQRDLQFIPIVPPEELDNSMASALDGRFDQLMSHWDIITRTLSELEKLAHKKILHLLKLGDSSRPVAFKPYPQRSQIIQLPADALHADLEVGEGALRTSRRISLALRTPRVTTGQARWSDWKEETRWLERQIGDGNNNKDRNFLFLLLLLTEFLGNHTAWLSSFAPELYARRQELLSAEQREAATVLSTRTVIICPDKMTARRLVFILSAFLPPLQRTDAVGAPTSPFAVHGATSTPSCSTSAKDAHANKLASDSNVDIFGSLSTFSSLNADDAVLHGSSSSPNGRPCPSSTARNAALRKSSLSILKNANKNTSSTSATASPTVACSLPGAVMPVAHFAGQPEANDDTADADFDMDDVSPASMSKDSLRSRMLLRKLHAGDSTSASSRDSDISPGTWGSYFSSFLGSASSQDRDGPQFQKNGHRKPNQQAQQFRARSSQNASINTLMSSSSESRKPVAISGAPTPLANDSTSPAQAHTTRTARPEVPPLNTSLPLGNAPPSSSPLKVSVGATSNIVDVEIPMNGLISFPSSADSKMASLHPYLDSGIGFGTAGAALHPNPQKCNDNLLKSMPMNQDTLDINAAGWLRRFHPDFALQAVQPYSALKDQVKKAMSAEETPLRCLVEYQSGRWVDVCTTLFADTRTLSLSRLTLRRRNRQLRDGNDGNVDDGVEEMFKEEGVTDALDSGLTEAVEKMISRNTHSSSSNQMARFNQRDRDPHSTAATSRPHIATHFALPQTPQDLMPTNIPLPGEASPSECHNVISNTLHKIVQAVLSEPRLNTSEHDFESLFNNSTYGYGYGTGMSRRASTSVSMQSSWRSRRAPRIEDYNNALREGVRKWVNDVDVGFLAHSGGD